MTPDLRHEQLLALASLNAAEFWECVSPRAERWADAWAADMGSPEPICNSITLLEPLTLANAQDLTRRLDSFYGQTDGAGFILWSAWPTPDLTSLGYGAIGQPPFMVRAASAPPIAMPANLRIAEITDAEELATFERCFVDWYPFPLLSGISPGSVFPARSLGRGNRYWIGYEGDTPMTVAAAVAGENLIGVYAVATSPAARGKGYGGAVTDVAARCVPHVPAFLKSSDLGFRVYERIGFKRVDLFTLWYRDRMRGQG
jgi:GNAT superfamily N-acetyltransferase